MSVFLSTVAGNGGAHPAPLGARGDIYGTDLGYLFEGGKQFAPSGRSSLWVGSIFGDSFSHPDPHHADGAGWRSPVIARASNTDFLQRGTVIDNWVGGDRARTAWPYERTSDVLRIDAGTNAASYTVIPCDAIQLPDHSYLGAGFRVRQWGTGPDQHMCYTAGCAFWRSTEPHAEQWEPAREPGGRRFEFRNAGRDAFFQNVSMILRGDHLYIFGTAQGRTSGPDGGIYLRRVPWERATDPRAHEFWGWDGRRWRWARDASPTPILMPLTPGGPIGEINAQAVGDRVVLMYTDLVAGSVALVADAPDAVWSSPTIVTPRQQLAQQYAPSLHPWTRDLSAAMFHISSWQQLPGPDHRLMSIDYATYAHRASLVADVPAGTVPRDMRAVSTATMSTHQAAEYLGAIRAASAEANPA